MKMSCNCSKKIFYNMMIFQKHYSLLLKHVKHLHRIIAISSSRNNRLQHNMIPKFFLISPLVKPERFVFTIKSSNENFCKRGIINITCSAVGKPLVHTYQLFKDETPVHTSNNSVLFWSQGATAGGEIVYSCVANNTVATASTTKNITVNGNYCWIILLIFSFTLIA